ncbi:MAG: hypothetical protein AB7S68_16925 [Polyangiaceae bacterium]
MVVRRALGAVVFGSFSAVLFGALGSAGCQSIAGIEDRTFDPDGGTGGTSSALCKTYCDDIMAACTGTLAQYASVDTCMATCEALPAGNSGDTSGDSVECRVRQARLAASTGEPAVHCPNAGPGGNGACGTNCESYCMLFAKACPDDADLVLDCPASCQGLKDRGALDVELDHGGDTLQCRLVHTSSALVDPIVHCSHAQLAPIAGEWCTEPAEATSSCDDYCRLVTVACAGEDAVYDSEAQCKKACASFTPGASTDTTEDTLGCRKYHSYNSIAAPSIHCPHASVGGDGHCGTTNCPGYCKLLEATCAEDFGTTFVDQAGCEAACASVDGADKDSGFSITVPDGNTLQCRIRHLLQATSDATECASAIGAGKCQ